MPEVADKTPENSRHRYFAPQSYAGAIHRHGLMAAMLRQPAYGVVVVQAPAGYGKSTLLQQVKTAGAAAGARTAWLTLEKADNDPRRFIQHLNALIDVLGGPDRKNTGPAASRLAELGGPVQLFLDEFQTLTNRTVLQAMRDLVERLPENTTVFIGARALPEIGLTRLMVNNQALVLRADDLRFSESEAEAFFAQAQDLAVSRQERAAIYRQTEGWPAALQLFRLSLASPSVRGALNGLAAYKPRELADYLAENVLSLQPPRIQRFLRETAVLTRLSGGLCDEVTGIKDSQTILQFLERSGLFLRSLDSDLSWFRYHTLFSSYLIDQGRAEDPAMQLQVHQRAASWFYRHGMYEEALHHAVAARDYTLSTEIMNLWCERLIVDGNLGTVERWAESMPVSAIERHPALAVKIAWALLFLRRHHALVPLQPALAAATAQGLDADIVRAMQAVIIDDIPLAFGIVEPMQLAGVEARGFRAFELGAAANLRAYAAFSAADFDATRDFITLARHYNRRGQAAFSAGYSVSVLGMSLLMQGRLKDSLANYRMGLDELQPDLEKSFSSAALTACYLHALYEHNELDAAESMFVHHHDAITDSVLLDFLASGYIAMARIHDIRGRPNRAEDLLSDAEELAHTAGWPRLLRITAWERVRRALLAGETDRAQAIASRIPAQPEFLLPNGGMVFWEAVEGDAIGRIRLALHGGQEMAALASLAGEIASAKRHKLVFRLIKLLVLEALAQKRLGQAEAARQSLNQALLLGAEEGFARLFLDEGEMLLALLRSEQAALAREAPVLRDFMSSLLGDASGPGGITTGFQPLEPLTEREVEILGLLAKGLSNKEIALRTEVSENTIKFHLKNIYSKLAVNSRLQAVNATRQMALLR